MTQSIYISDQGELLLIDAPEKSSNRYVGIADDATLERHYQTALASAIKDGVKFKDQEQVTEVIKNMNYSIGRTGKIWPNEIYVIPTGYKVSFEDDCTLNECNCPNPAKEGHVKLAILSKLEEHPLQKLADKMQNIEPEFQEVVNKNWDKLVAPSEEVKLNKGSLCEMIKADLNDAIEKQEQQQREEYNKGREDALKYCLELFKVLE